MSRAEYKVPGGKLLAAETEVEDGRLVTVKITGDFFMHPEAAIIDLEEALTGKPLVEIDGAVEAFFEEKEITLFGASPRDFSHVLKLSLKPQEPVL